MADELLWRCLSYEVDEVDDIEIMSDDDDELDELYNAVNIWYKM